MYLDPFFASLTSKKYAWELVGYIAFFKEGFSIFKGIPGFLVSHRCNLYDIFVLPFADKVLSIKGACSL